METPDKEKNKKIPKKLKKDSAAYLRQREKANARKRKFLDKMTEEQKEIKRAKDREYYRKKKAEKKVKKITDMTEREKRKQRKDWKKASKKYREKKKSLANLVSNTPPQSDDDLAAVPPERRQVGRKIVRKDRAKAYRKIKKQDKIIIEMKRKIASLKKKLVRRDAKIKTVPSPIKKVDALIKDITVPPEVRKQLIFSEVLTKQLQEKADVLPKNSKEREAFHKCISGSTLRKYKMLHMAKKILPTRPKKINYTSILKSDTKVRKIVLKQEVQQKVIDFFEQDDVSRMCPSKRDSVKQNGIKKQRRVLLHSVKNLVSRFVKETGIVLSYATLLRAKPFWVVAPKSRDRETCLCIKHANFEEKFNKLKYAKELKHASIEEFIEQYTCDVKSHDCMNSLCEKCKIPEFESEDNRDSLTYFTWKSVQEDKIVKGIKKTFKITKKILISSTVNELKIALFEDIPAMKKHLYGIYSYNKLKKELKDNLRENEVMIQIDFSENYTTKYANEIQSTHFAKNQLSIHTGVYYLRSGNSDLKSKSFATVNDTLDHQAHAIWAHMKPILTTILENKQIDTVHIYSDGPTSQYRNRTNVTLWIQTLINDFQQVTKSTWTFSEAGHGKGPMDGVGGYLKRTADRHVLMGNDVRTASEFADLFKNAAIEVKVIPEDDVIEEKNRVPKSLDAIPGIMDITRVYWQKGLDVLIHLYRYEHFHKELKLSKLSSLCNMSAVEPEEVFMPAIESPVDEEPMITDNDLRFKNRVSIYKSVYCSSSSDNEDLETISHRQQIKVKQIDVEANTSYGKENIHPNLVSPGTFLLVKVPTEKPNVCFRYVATCQTCVDDDDGEMLVTFLRSVRNNIRKFKLEPKDISYIDFEQIISIIPTPTLKKEKSQEYYYFDNDIDVFEK